MDFTPSNLDATFNGYRTIYDNAFGKQKVYAPQIAEIIPSDSRKEVYAFLDRVPKLRQWIGERRIANFVAQSYELLNGKFELTLGVSREDIEDNKIGLYNQRVRRMGQQAAKWPDQRLKLALQSGKTKACFDGQNFFATNHWTSFGKKTGAQANLFTSKPLTYDNFVSVKQSAMALLGADGEPLEDFGDDPSQVLLIVDPSNAERAAQITGGDYIPRDAAQGSGVATAYGSVTNTQKGAAKVLVVPQLANEPGVWYLADVADEKPLIFQMRYAPDFVPLVSPDSPSVFELDEFRMGIRARGEAGYGLWWKIMRCEP